MACVTQRTTLAALFTLTSAVACKTGGASQSNDIAGVPTNINMPAYVVYLTPDDQMIHNGECPSTNVPLNRQCPGLKDLAVTEKAKYEFRLTRAILARRSPGSPLNSSSPTLIKTLEEKIARLDIKLASSNLTADDRQNLTAQRADLQRQLAAAGSTPLTTDEQQRFDAIMVKLNANDDVTLDEGQLDYQLATTPFGGLDVMAFAEIQPGTFMMGSPGSDPDRNSDEVQHQVTLTKAFELLTTEVTQAQWYEVTGDNPSAFNARTNCPEDYREVQGVGICPFHPVENISWDAVAKFIQQLNYRQSNFSYRLPTEAEWEYAARAGSTGPFAGDLGSMAWYRDNSSKLSHAVGEKSPNPWGLYDMHGNVWEMTQDWQADYSPSPAQDPSGPNFGESRILRGGSWSSPAKLCRSAQRFALPPDMASAKYGFRLARSVRR